jgi:3-deoxy-D-manno-octulosonic-acid transferase
MPPPTAPTTSPTAGASSVAAELVLALYRGLGRVLSPAIPVLLARRAVRGKAEAARNAERYGRPAAARPAGRLVWVHAASVGETIAVVPLVERLLGDGFAVVFTSGTVTSAATAATRLPKGAVHQYAPLDVPTYVARFLDHWQPEIAIVAESEVWPATVVALDRRSIPIVIVNGRLSDRSFRRWTRFRAVVGPLFRRLSLVLAQSDEDGRRYTALGAPAVVVSGNLKWDAPPLAADLAELARLREAVGGRPAWVAASTHAGEEEIVIAAHRRLKQTVPRLLTVIVPRHPPRGDDVAAVLAAAGLKVARRSRGETPVGESEVYLADTLGELGLFYRLAPIAFIGNSLVAGGGHNPAEATELGAAVVSGSHVENFADVFARLAAAVPATIVENEAGLAAAIAPMLADPAIAARQAAAQARALAGLKGALDATSAALRPYLAAKATA